MVIGVVKYLVTLVISKLFISVTMVIYGTCRSEFGRNVAEEYLKFFDFENVSLDQALRLLLP